MPMLGAFGALSRGHEAVIILAGEAATLMRDAVADSLQGVGFPPLREQMAEMIDNQVPIYVGVGCAQSRGVTEDDLRGKNARFADPADFADLMLEADRVLSF